MTLGQLARMSGRGALVLRKMDINEAGPNFVHLEGRSAGLFSWLCTVVGIDTTTVFDVYEDRIEYSGGSLSGAFTETIPLTRISNLGTGFLKPFLLYFIPHSGSTTFMAFKRSLIEGVD